MENIIILSVGNNKEDQKMRDHDYPLITGL